MLPGGACMPGSPWANRAEDSMNVLMLVVSVALTSTQVESSARAGQEPATPQSDGTTMQAPAAAVQPLPPAAPPAADDGPIFPLWGDKVRKAGFELPPAFGVNNGPLRAARFIQFGESTAHANALAIRPSFMVFPFLSFYTVISSGNSVTEVNVTSPTAFTTKASSGAFVVSLGATTQFGYKG